MKKLITLALLSIGSHFSILMNKSTKIINNLSGIIYFFTGSPPVTMLTGKTFSIMKNILILLK